LIENDRHGFVRMTYCNAPELLNIFCSWTIIQHKTLVIHAMHDELALDHKFPSVVFTHDEETLYEQTPRVVTCIHPQ